MEKSSDAVTDHVFVDVVIDCLTHFATIKRCQLHFNPRDINSLTPNLTFAPIALSGTPGPHSLMASSRHSRVTSINSCASLSTPPTAKVSEQSPWKPRKKTCKCVPERDFSKHVSRDVSWLYRDVDRDDVAIQQLAVVGNSVTRDVVDWRTNRLGKTWINETLTNVFKKQRKSKLTFV